MPGERYYCADPGMEDELVLAYCQEYTTDPKKKHFLKGEFFKH